MTDILTKTDRRNFLGVPIIGEGKEGSTRTPQITKEEFAALVKPLLDHPDVLLFGWRQYTPYFNDGDTCEFSAQALYVVTTSDTEQYEDLLENDPYMVEETFNLGYEKHPTLGGRPYDWVGEWPDRKIVHGDYEGPDEALYDAGSALDGAIQSGKCDHVLLDLFGDHAQIVVTKERIEVEAYSHD